MHELTVEWCLDYLKGAYVRDISAKKHFDLINKVVGTIGEKNIQHFYIKNIFSKEFEQEYYFFTDEKIIICKYTENNNNYSLKVVHKANILSISFEEPLKLRDQDNSKLLIHLKDDTVLSFDSFKDSNEDWAYIFKEKIKQLFSVLS